MSNKKTLRLRRSVRTRAKIKELGAYRLCIHRTPRHIYAQIIQADGAHILTSASTCEKDFLDGATGNSIAAAKIGELIARRAVALGIGKVAFDRAGFKYHGRVKALAEAARAGGLEF